MLIISAYYSRFTACNTKVSADTQKIGGRKYDCSTGVFGHWVQICTVSAAVRELGLDRIPNTHEAVNGSSRSVELWMFSSGLFWPCPVYHTLHMKSIMQ